MTKDALEEWFVERGYEVRPYYLRKTAIQLGWQVTYRGCELSWRCEGQRVWIVMFRRCEGRVGLVNPFASLYLLAEAVFSVLGEGFSLYGNVQVLADSPLQSSKLSHFYRRWTGASEVEPGWFELDAGRVVSLRNIRKQQRSTSI